MTLAGWRAFSLDLSRRQTHAHSCVRAATAKKCELSPIGPPMLSILSAMKDLLSLPSALGPSLLHRFRQPLSAFRRQSAASLALLNALRRGLRLPAPLSRTRRRRSHQRGDRFADPFRFASQVCHDSIYFQRLLLCCHFRFVVVSQRIVSGLQFHLSISLADPGS